MPRNSSLAPTGIEVRTTPSDISVIFDLDGRTYIATFTAQTRWLYRVAVLKHTAKGTTFWQELGAGATLARVAALAAEHIATDPFRTDAELWRAVAARYTTR
jgi:hypothetical protein